MSSPDDDYTCDECGGHGGDHDDDCDEKEEELPLAKFYRTNPPQGATPDIRKVMGGTNEH